MTLLVLLLLFQNNPNFNSDRKSLALDGYDPVSYFLGSGPQPGSEDLTVTHEGILYYFTNSANKQTFEANPNKYVPEYGGWCAYAMGETGEKVKVDPTTFKIVNGRNNLFYNFRGYNTLDDWNKNEALLIPKAKSNWDSITRPDH